jgi:YD repeat-containing protein
VHTVYSYNGVDLPTLILQGTDQQERDFQYDLLGRLTAQYLPEKSRTLDVHGLYLGPEGRWSDVFEYNDRSNLVSHVDARGVKTVYDFDALNRLQSVYYPSVARVDSSSPILPSPDASYSYCPRAM